MSDSGRQMPYVEDELPEMIFASSVGGSAA
jgi:hypothetical protein